MWEVKTWAHSHLSCITMFFINIMISIIALLARSQWPFQENILPVKFLQMAMGPVFTTVLRLKSLFLLFAIVGSLVLTRENYQHHSMQVWRCMPTLTCEIKVYTYRYSSNRAKFLFPEKNMWNIEVLIFFVDLYI